MQMFDHGLATQPIWVIGLVVFAFMAAAAGLGVFMRRRRPKAGDDDEGEGYMVSAVLGLLALLLGFSFSMAVDRFDARRILVVEEANAIGTAYLRAQLLPEPHRARMSRLLVAYTDNRIALAAAPPAGIPPLLTRNDALLTDLWAGVAAAFVDIRGLDFSSTFVDGMNNLIDLDSARKAARLARVPTEVLMVLVFYVVVTSAVLGYVLDRRRGQAAAAVMLLLLGLSLLLIIDIDRPMLGGVRESQAPMERLRQSLALQPPPVFDKYLAPAPEGAR